MILEILLLCLTALAVFSYYIKTVRWDYWKKQGVFQIPGCLPYGELMMTKHLTNVVVSRCSFV